MIAIAGCIFSAISMGFSVTAPAITVLIISIIWLSIGWVPFLGLKVLKPQEALVLTLFGNYVGTLKEAGFYFVNPFCTSVNPASKTKHKITRKGNHDCAVDRPFREPVKSVRFLFLKKFHGETPSLKGNCSVTKSLPQLPPKFVIRAIALLTYIGLAVKCLPILARKYAVWSSA